MRPIPCLGILADHRATTPWRPALMTRGQNHHPQAAGLSLCSFRFYPRGFTKMEARKAARSMTRVTDDWTQLASCFPFPFYSPCRAVRYGGAACSARGQQVRCRRLLLPRRRPLRSLASAHFRLAGWLGPVASRARAEVDAHHERYSGSDAMGQLRSCSRVFRAILQLQVHD